MAIEFAERLECGGFSAVFIGRKSGDTRGKAVVNHRISPNALRCSGTQTAACLAVA
jgi:hypothetical protein